MDVARQAAEEGNPVGGQDKPSDLVLSALVRARFCELVSMKIPRSQSDLFLVGMVSMMDAILEIPMDEILAKIALDKDTKMVLSGGGGRLKPVYDLMMAQEAGRWDAAKQAADQLRISESETGEMWWQAMQWGRQVKGFSGRRDADGPARSGGRR